MNPNFENLRWLAGALSVGCTSAVMVITGTVHPPAGATALLFATDPAISGLDWWYILIVVVCSVMTLAISCLVNNVQRQFPIYWWTPQGKITTVKEPKDEEDNGDMDVKRVETDVGDIGVHSRKEILVSENGVLVPENLYLSAEERSMLKILQERLRDTEIEAAEDQDRGHEGMGGSEKSLHSKMSRDTDVATLKGSVRGAA